MLSQKVNLPDGRKSCELGFWNLTSKLKFASPCFLSLYRLPSWLTYWSEGWHASVDRYRHKIYQLLIAMHEESENVLPLNQVHLYNNYWSNPVFDIIDRLMRSTKPISADYLADHRLMDLARSYSEMEEKRIEANLDHFKWVIDDSSTLRLITGPGRIERVSYIQIMTLE